MSDDVTGFVMGALGRTLNDVFAAAGLPEDCDDLDYALDVISGARNKLRRLDAALTELAHHGDLTPAGKRKLEQILGGDV